MSPWLREKHWRTRTVEVRLVRLPRERNGREVLVEVPAISLIDRRSEIGPDIEAARDEIPRYRIERDVYAVLVQIALDATDLLPADAVRILLLGESKREAVLR
jgi:hypothetical protein